VAPNQAYHMHKASRDARRSELRRTPIRANFRVFPIARIKGSSDDGRCCRWPLPSASLLLFFFFFFYPSSYLPSHSLQHSISISLMCCCLQSACYFIISFHSAGLRCVYLSHLNSIAWVWIVWYRFLQFAIIKTCSWGCHT
jgi:hypothetical protein